MTMVMKVYRTTIPQIRRTVSQAAFGLVLGLGLIAVSGFVPTAAAQQPIAAERAQTPSDAADRGIVGLSLGLSAETVGAPARLVVRAVVPHSPAYYAGILRGDQIVAIDGQQIDGKSLRDVVAVIRGEVGTQVALTLDREGKAREASLTRVQAAVHRQAQHGHHGCPAG